MKFFLVDYIYIPSYLTCLNLFFSFSKCGFKASTPYVFMVVPVVMNFLSCCQYLSKVMQFTKTSGVSRHCGFTKVLKTMRFLNGHFMLCTHFLQVGKDAISANDCQFQIVYVDNFLINFRAYVNILLFIVKVKILVDSVWSYRSSQAYSDTQSNHL